MKCRHLLLPTDGSDLSVRSFTAGIGILNCCKIPLLVYR